MNTRDNVGGYGNIKNKYIAAQGPNDVNIYEFVRMLWDVKTGKIAMVTNLHEAGAMKCLKYWPSSGKVKTFRKIKIELIEEDVLAHFTIRTLKISKGGCGSRTIKHCHYTSWPDKGVPTDMASLVEFRNKILKVKSPQPGPMVVHCSAGIGRTGTFLALDYLIEEGKAEGSVDVFKCVSQMRKERTNMVQTDDQYVFLHEAILEWYIAGDTTTTVTDYQGVYQDLLKVKQSSGKCELEEKFEMMNQVCPKYTDADYSTALMTENEIKNRVPTILAYENTRILLTIPVPNTTDYINAVYIPSYRKKRAYILTQTPLPNTVIDFWRMVVQKESQTIVHMDHEQDKTKGIGQYLPGDKPLSSDPFTITKTEEIQHEFYTIITCQVTGNSQDNEIDHTVRIYQCTFWKGEETTLKSSTPFFTLLEHIQSWTYDQKENPIIVHCRNGVNKGGLFCVLAAILERLTIEQDVSVLQTIIQLRVSRPQIITCYEQVKFCFDAVGNYLDNFSMYANSC
ncbi:receptor-type tyrosine-protein phosphatase alpha-like [Patella vulgata]|uniref:receptor-type tyrosine-protein phosphatase alpha-like n=1 Tax=Patella vulgata TaxID=6465 RepID=UPI0021806847|nr:receptor-type tyrosine-protein phosphatase alpha-like [Patella vulgata]